MPAFAGDALPASQTGTLIALADRLDSLVGLFGIGQIPTGSKDPFALRRASLGVLRLLVEKEINIDLSDLIDWAIGSDWATAPKTETKATLTEYLLDRFSAWYADEGIPAGVFQSVRALGITNALDINRRVQAVHAFNKLDAAEALAAGQQACVEYSGEKRWRQSGGQRGFCPARTGRRKNIGRTGCYQTAGC